MSTDAMRIANTWRGSAPGGLTPPAGARNQAKSPLAETLSPGRQLAFGCNYAPIPFVAGSSVTSAQTAYYTIADWRAGKDMPECTMLGFRADLRSCPVAGPPPAWALDVFGQPESELLAYQPYGNVIGSGAAIIIASGSVADDVLKLGPRGGWSIAPTILPAISSNVNDGPNLSTPGHLYVLQFPIGDLWGTEGAISRMERTIRDMPFGVRIPNGTRLAVAFAVRGDKYNTGALNNPGAYMPLPMNGEILVTTVNDDRTLSEQAL